MSGGSLLRVGARGLGVAEGEEEDEDEGKEVRGRDDGIEGREGGREEEEEGEGVEVELRVGDVIVLPVRAKCLSILHWRGRKMEEGSTSDPASRMSLFTQRLMQRVNAGRRKPLLRQFLRELQIPRSLPPGTSRPVHLLHIHTWTVMSSLRLARKRVTF